MAQWRIKELSNMTKVSVRMLHHYDKIGLLRPCVRASNGYRWYSLCDLEKLQQIIALKFFGFNLKAIKTMLSKPSGIYEHLCFQQQMLEEQEASIYQTQHALAKTIAQCKQSGFPDWNSLITLIERYNMTKELKDTWAGKLNEVEQVRYGELKKQHPKTLAAWDAVIEAINSKKYTDPEGPDGEYAIKAFMAVMNLKEVASLDKPIISNKEMLDSIERHKSSEIPFNPEGNTWFAQALVAYKLKRWKLLYQEISKNIDADPKGSIGQKIAKQWIELIQEHAIGMPVQYFVGMTLWTDLLRSKKALQPNQSLTEAVPPASVKDSEDYKFFFDGQAVGWIAKALENK